MLWERVVTIWAMMKEKGLFALISNLYSEISKPFLCVVCVCMCVCVQQKIEVN